MLISSLLPYIGPFLVFVGFLGLVYAVTGLIRSRRRPRPSPPPREKKYMYHLENGRFSIKPKE